MKAFLSASLCCLALEAGAGCPVDRPGLMPPVPDITTASRDEMYRSQLALEQYLAQGRGYIDCRVMNRRQHNRLLSVMEMADTEHRWAFIEFHTRHELLADTD
jgi:hypothetical protein